MLAVISYASVWQWETDLRNVLNQISPLQNDSHFGPGEGQQNQPSAKLNEICDWNTHSLKKLEKMMLQGSIWIGITTLLERKEG